MNRDANDPDKAAFVGSDARFYIIQVTSDIYSTTRALKAVAPSGIKEVDAYIAGLVNALDGIQPQLPQQNDPRG